MPAWTIRQWPMREQPDELLAELYHARAALHDEAEPGDPRQPLADEITAVRVMPAPNDGVVLVARDDAGAVAGVASCAWEQLPGWDHAQQTEVEVLPERRRQGLGRLLLERSVGVAEQRGLRLMLGGTRDNVPAGAGFCAGLGMEQAMVSEENRLDLQAVDPDLVDRWIAEGPVRAPGYRLQFVAGRTPDELAEQVAGVLNVMNTAPREQLDVGDSQMTTELLREYESAAAASGRERWACYAVEEATGRFVGLTDVTFRPWSPDRVTVGDTGVASEHRGHALGKWLKASLTRKILEERPAVRWVITWNAGSNDAMLSINRQLGYRVSAVHTFWQAPTAKLRTRLGAPGGSWQEAGAGC